MSGIQATAGDHADAALLSLCAEHERLEADYRARPETEEDDLKTPPGYFEAISGIAGAPAHTLDGWRAKARAFVLYNGDSRPSSNGVGEDILLSLVADLIDVPAGWDADQEADTTAPEPLSPAEQSALAHDDPWRAQLGCPPFREQFPLWTMRPDTMAKWSTTAPNEFVILKFCEAFQREGMAGLEEKCCAHPEEMARVLEGFVGLQKRFAAMANALHGKAMRLGLASVRVRTGEPASNACLFGLAVLNFGLSQGEPS